MNPVKHLTSALMGAALVAVLAPSAHASTSEILGLNAAERIANDATLRWDRQHPVDIAVTAQLKADGLPAEQIDRMLIRVDHRAKDELKRFAMSLEGHALDKEEVREAIAARESVLRYDIQSDPESFAEGRAFRFHVGDADIARLQRGLAATWIEREGPLRSKLRDMVTMEDLNRADVKAVRFLAREITLEHARKVLSQMRGAPFFSPTDAELYLEQAFNEEIATVCAVRLGDATSASQFVEEAKLRYVTADIPVGANAEAEMPGRPHVAIGR